jgi:Ca-activated chloride channel homolog
MSLRSVFNLLVATLAFSTILPGQPQPEAKSFPASPGDTLVVQDDFGRVQVRVSDVADVQARIQMVSPGAPNADFQVASQKAGREIYIYAFFSGRGQEAVNLDIQVPKFLNVVVWGANPEVEARGIQGSLRIQNISGAITVEDPASSVTAVSDRGDILFRAHAQPHGDIRLETTSGTIRGEVWNNLNLRGWLTAGGSIAWDKDPEVRATSTEKQIGSFGPLVNMVSLQGNIRVSVTPPGAATTEAAPPKATVPPKSEDRGGETAQKAPAVQQGPRRGENRSTPGDNGPAPKAVSRAETARPAPSPATPVSSDQGVAIKVSVDSVLLNVSVRDRTTNRSVMGLQKGDFRVYEDNIPQQLQDIKTAEAPYSLLLLMDVSGSTQSYLKLMKEAATDFTRQLNQNDRIAVASFNSSVQLLQDFTSDRNVAAKAISRLHSGGGTAFYDALMTCVDQYMRTVEGRKAIVVFTDGVDNALQGNPGEGSRTPFRELYSRIQEVDTIIYTIFLDSEGQMPAMTRGPMGYPGGGRRYPGVGRFPFPFPIPSPSPYPTPGPTGSPYPGGGNDRAAYETAREQLESIAEQTGGRMYSPKRAQDLTGVYSEIADDLRIQYLLSYASTNTSEDGGWRAIRVEVNDHPEAVVRTRKGYVKSQNSEARIQKSE